jgi:hypothetical protein
MSGLSEIVALGPAPASFVGLELAVATACALTLAHALGERRRGDGWPLFQWLTALAYGVLIEIVAYNTWDNYQQGRFTVQLYHHKLPLYVTFVYPAFHYSALKLVEARRLRWLPEALLVGLCLVLIDIPYDTFGPGAGWWRWSDSDPNMKVRWLGVPVTSYYWYLLFGAIYAALLRALRPRLEPWTRRAASYLFLPPMVGAAVLALGIVAFIPFHLLKRVGAPDGAIVAVHMAAVAVIAWTTRRTVAAPAKIRASILILQLYPALLMVLMPPSQWAAKAAAMAAAIAGIAVIGSSRVGSARALPSPDARSTPAPTADSPRRSGT